MTMVRLAPESTTVTVTGTVTASGNATAVLSTTQFPVLNSTGVNFVNINSTVANFTIASAGTSAVTGLRVRLLGLIMGSPSSATFYLGSDSALSTNGGIAFGSSANGGFGISANGGFVLPLAPLGMWWLQTSAGTTQGAPHLNVVANTTGPWTGVAVYTVSS